MRRADRLFQIIQLLRKRRVTTAAQLAQELEISERTVYRDIRDLMVTGVPIEGEAGIGYRLPKGFDLPPLMFTIDEIEALVLGARVVKNFSDRELAKAADSVLRKVEAVLPDRLKHRVESSVLFAPNFRGTVPTADHLRDLRLALRESRKVRLLYRDAADKASERTIRPMCLAFIPPVWLVAGWCELRESFRNFRLDRIQRIDLLETRFQDEPGRTLEDFMRLVNQET